MGSVNQRGITLITVVLIVVFVSLMVAGVTIFIVQRLLEFDSKRAAAEAIYLAQAGINQSIYSFRSNALSGNGYFTLGRTDVEAGRYFVVGGEDGDLLMVNTSLVTLSASQREILNLRLQNAANSRPITVQRMRVSWNNNNRLQRVVIHGTRVWQGSEVSPADLNLKPVFTLDTVPSVYLVDEIRFNGIMTGATVAVQFFLSDGSARQAVIYPAANNNNFIVKSTGQAQGASVFRTIEAEYNALTARIVRMREINTQIIP